MKRKLICILLSAVLLFTMVPSMMLKANAASELTASENCINLLKQMEGFSAKPYWDYARYSVGYGTACPSEEDRLRYEAEGISEEEATMLLKKYVDASETRLNKFAKRYALELTQQQFDALILFTYNCGTGWMSSDGSLRRAVINGASGNDFLYAICLWCVAGGRVQPFLLDRRLKEANVYLNGVYSISVPDQYSYVMYNGNGGASSIRAQGYAIDEPIAPVASAQKDGAVFSGWFTDKDGGIKVTKLDGSVRGMKLYAHWDETGSGHDTQVPDQTKPNETTPEGKPDIFKPAVITVTGDYVNIRTAPGTDSEIVDSVNSGKQITVTATAEASGYLWGKFEDGWICLKYTNYDSVRDSDDSKPENKPESKPENKPENKPEQKPESVKGVVYDADWLRIRSSAGTSSSIVGYLSTGARVEIFEQTMVGDVKWGRIEKGWISMDYVKLDSDDAQQPDHNTPEQPDNNTPQPPEKDEDQDPAIQVGFVVDTNELRIRTGAGLDHSVVGYLTLNTRVEISERADADGMEWGHIDRGWISLDYVKFESDEPSDDKVIDTGYVKDTNSLRIRSGAGTHNSVLGYLTMDTKVEIYEKETVGSMVWGRIDQGWISLDYIRLDSDTSSSGSIRTVDTSCLRIRSDAGLSNEIVGYLTIGDRVEILDQKMADGMPWGQISRGWICLDYVR